MSDILKVENLCKSNILSNISFKVQSGEMVAIMGPSGSGKSTLLYNISGMDQPDSGKVYLAETELVSLTEDEKAKLRLSQIGFVFQQMNVLKNLTIIDNIMFPTLHLHKQKSFKQALQQKALKLMQQFDIADLANRKVTEVSGGQLQRACICRSMLTDPKIIFADEPTGALNQTASTTVIDSFLKLNQQNMTILIVTHDSLVASKCDRILYILDGQIRGELELGKFSSTAQSQRESKTKEWLTSLGW